MEIPDKSFHSRLEQEVAMTYGRIVIVAAALLTLAACSEHSPAAPTAAALADRAVAATDLAGSPARPFGGRCDTAFTFHPLAGDPPNLFRLHIEYVCQLQHLGRTTAIAEQIVTFTGPTTAIASNTTTYTAANGDQLFASWTGTSVNDGPLVTFSGTELYAGGTGRFAGATGSSLISGSASFVTNTGQFTSTGTLRY
jgi:hypothetical protein